MIYLDNAATSAPLDSVCEKMNYVNRECFANASAAHAFGFSAEKLVNESRRKIADFLGVKPETITFTAGGTESDNIAIRGYLTANPRGGNHIITTAIEHPAVLEVFRHLEAKEGYRVTRISVDGNGVMDYQQLEEAIGPDTALISVMLVNNEVGSIQDIAKVSAIRNRKNPKAVLHVDAVQAFGKMKILPEKLGIDLLAASGHKFYGPKGIGILYAKKGLRLQPVEYGGGHEKGLRSGTLNTPAIAGLHDAVCFAESSMTANTEKVRKLKETLLNALYALDLGAKVNGDAKNASPYILNISFPWVKSEVLLHHLAERDIYVSSGSACSTNHKSRTYSHVLTAMDVPAEYIDSAIRISFSYANTEEEMLETAKAIGEIVPKIRYKNV